MLNELLSKSRALPWKIGDTLLSCQPTPLIMGIVNVTPDSFFDGGQHNTLDAAFEHALKLLEPFWTSAAKAADLAAPLFLQTKKFAASARWWNAL